MQSDIVQRLRDYRSRDDWGDLMRHEICDEAAAEITRLTEALRLQMEAKHKEAAEAKLWFSKAQEWKEALRAAEEREKALREALIRAESDLYLIALDSSIGFRLQQDVKRARDNCSAALRSAKPSQEPSHEAS